MRYVPALDGLRALAVAAVIGLHADLPLFGGGALGVDVFFVISGFLITALLLRELDRSGRIDLGAFVVRRVRRLMPALLVMVVVVGGFAAVAPLTLSDQFDYPGLFGGLAAAAGYVANLVIATGGEVGPMFHTWSLGVEMQFYVLWPLIVLLAARRGYGLPALLIGLAVVFAWRAVVHLGGSEAHVLYGLDTRADMLLAGAAVALLARDGRLPERALARIAPLALAVLAVFVLADPSVDVLVAGGYVVIYLCAAVLVAHAVTDTAAPAPLRRLLALPVIVYVGRLSYSLYLWHFPVFHALTAEALGVGRGPSIVIRVAVMTALAVASYHLVENRLRARRASAAEPVPVAA